MKQILLYTLPAIMVGASVYGFSISTPEELIEKQNRQAIIECLDTLSGSSVDIQKWAIKCSKTQFKTIWTATGAIIPVPPKWYTQKYSLILTGSTVYTKYSDRKWAGWKNNNPSWLTWWVSNTLKLLWDNAWIRYKIGSPRPANEKGNYIYFETVEEGLRAKIIAIRERWGNATVSHYLGWWGTDDLKLSFDKSKIIKELSEDEFMELFVQQLNKETPQYIEQLKIDKILI